MKRVTIDFQNVPEGITNNEIYYAIRFALAEYIASRSPAIDYVYRRYEHMTADFQNDKIDSVQRCLDLVSGPAEIEITEHDG